MLTVRVASVARPASASKAWEDMNMKTLVKLVVALSLAFAIGGGCGSSGGKTDIVNINGDASKPDTSDVNPLVDAGVDMTVVTGPEVGVDSGPVVVGKDGGTADSICAGLSVDDCQLAIINAPTEATVSAQDVSGPVPPAYLTCIAL